MVYKLSCSIFEHGFSLLSEDISTFCLQLKTVKVLKCLFTTFLFLSVSDLLRREERPWSVSHKKSVKVEDISTN